MIEKDEYIYKLSYFCKNKHKKLFLLSVLKKNYQDYN